MIRFIEGLVARGGPSAAVASLRRGSRLVLAYHNIVPDSDESVGEQSLHLPLSRFREQLDALQRSHDVVSLSEILVPKRGARRPLVAITFDDAYRGCLTLGLPELERRGLPSTVFVAPRLIGSAGCWWDQLSSPETGSMDPEVRDQVLTTLVGDGEEALRWALSRGLVPRDCPPVAGIGTEEELLAAARLGGVSFGAHSWSHRNLPLLSELELDRELRAPMDWLRERIPGVMPWLAFPYGLHSPRVTAHARRAGYDAVLRIFGGRMSAADDVSREIPRLNIPAAVRTDRFMLLTRGLLPLT